MTTTRLQPIVYPQEHVKERYVTRRWLLFFRYDVVISKTSLGYDLIVEAYEAPKAVFINGTEYVPTTKGKEV